MDMTDEREPSSILARQGELAEKRRAQIDKDARASLAFTRDATGMSDELRDQARYLIEALDELATVREAARQLVQAMNQARHLPITTSVRHRLARLAAFVGLTSP